MVSNKIISREPLPVPNSLQVVSAGLIVSVKIMVSNNTVLILYQFLVAFRWAAIK